jgi:hypothetical protein
MLLNKREAAARARISERTLERILAAGDGSAVTRIAGRVLIWEDYPDAWIEALHRNAPVVEFSLGFVG